MLAFLLLAAGVFPARAESLRILHTNDMHAHLEPFVTPSGDTLGGWARLATLIDRERGAAAAALVVDAGDLFQGTPYYNFFRGEAEVRCLDRIGYDAMALGNHELDDGALNVLKQFEQWSGVPLLSANIEVPAWLKSRAATMAAMADKTVLAGAARTQQEAAHDSTLGPIGLPWLVRRTGGLQVGLIGVTTETLPRVVTKKGLADVTIRPVVDTVRRILPEVRRQSDLVVVLSHCGLAADSLLAATVPGIDVIVSGHDHKALLEPRFVANPANDNGIGGTLLVEAGEWGGHLGRLDLEVDGSRITHWEGRLLPVTPDLPPAPRVQELVDAYAARLRPLVEEPLTINRETLPSDSLLLAETAVGNLVADLMRDAARADIAVQNGGGIRSPLSAGPVTVGDVYALLPFDNTLVTMELPGRLVEAMLEESAARRGRGGFLQLSGVSFVVAEQGRVRDVRVGDRPLDPGRIYRVVTNNFTAAGGDGFTVFARAMDVQDTGLRVRDAVMNALRKLESIAPRREGRIRFDP